MWVFIDDQLVLDIGGLHQPVDGTINFQTGIATITGKATQAGHSDNTGANAIVTAQGAVDPRGNNFEFYSALNMPNGGDGKTHTMKIFYVERGGCDSNCMISFNLPLVRGKADAKVAKYDKTANPSKPLTGVKFGLYSDAGCTDLIEEVSSDENGQLLFKNLPIINNDQKYYLKETYALPGYIPSTDIYTLEVAEDSSGNYYFKVMKDGEEIETIGQQPAIPVVYNEPVPPIDLTVEKQWKDQNNNTINPPANASATFQVKRYYYDVDTSQPCTFRVYRYKDNQTPKQEGPDYTFKGGTQVNINWEYDYWYIRSDPSRKNKYKENPEESSFKLKSDDGPAVINLPDTGTAAIYINDENLNTQWGPGVINITVDGTPYSSSTPPEPVWREDQTYDGPTLTLPSNNSWTGVFEDLPLFEEKHNYTRMYKYYIVETARTPADSEIVYVDGEGHVVADPSTLMTDQSSTQTVINKVVLMDLNILKIDKDKTVHKLPGAVFALRKIVENPDPIGNTIHYADDEVMTSNSTDSDGKTGFSDITSGYYEVTETVVPEGYVISGEKTFYVRISASGVDLLQKDLTKAPKDWAVISTGGIVVEVSKDLQAESVQFTVANEPGAQLPNTGGFGTSVIYLLGSILAFGAGSMLLRRRFVCR